MRTAGRSIGHRTIWFAMHRSKGIVMNKQIKELEKQCWSHRVDGVLVDGHLHFDTEKFAQLIVQECIDIISPYTVRMNRPGEEFLHPISEIKKRFGVE